MPLKNAFYRENALIKRKNKRNKREITDVTRTNQLIILFIICRVRAIINKNKIDIIIFINCKKKPEKHE
jgi:hypothetical protein